MLCTDGGAVGVAELGADADAIGVTGDDNDNAFIGTGGVVGGAAVGNIRGLGTDALIFDLIGEGERTGLVG